MDMVNEWTSLSMPALLTVGSSRKDWKKISAALFVIIIIIIYNGIVTQCKPPVCTRARRAVQENQKYDLGQDSTSQKTTEEQTATKTRKQRPITS